ncbi:MAG TPA: hypothetical protein PLC40_20305 [Candidatus Hydrogenedentes bacterium]|nr:hypothetical protein [Candidatus Hydrogenedentota bacterium]
MNRTPGGHRHTVASIKSIEHAEGAASHKCFGSPQQLDDTCRHGSMSPLAGGVSSGGAQDAQTGGQ